MNMVNKTMQNTYQVYFGDFEFRIHDPQIGHTLYFSSYQHTFCGPL